jgi:hypothetical protein
MWATSGSVIGHNVVKVKEGTLGIRRGYFVFAPFPLPARSKKAF